MGAPFFSQEPYLYIFLGSIGVWVLSDLTIKARFQHTPVDSQDRKSKHVIGVAVAGGILGAVILSLAFPGLEIGIPHVTFWAGIGLMVTGIILRQYAVRTLGQYFSLVVAVDESDSVITTGPYEWVRHPSYTGSLLTLVGLGLSVGHWLSLAIIVAGGLFAYGYRIHVEERALQEQLGESYADYATQTPYRLFPYVW